MSTWVAKNCALPSTAPNAALERVVAARRRDRVEPRQIEMLIVHRVGQLMRQRVALGEIEVAVVAQVDELAVDRVVEPHHLTGLERQHRITDRDVVGITPMVCHATVRRS